MIRSKYLGREFDAGWTVTSVELAGRYGKRKKAKGNTYRFILTRKTSDDKCDKSLKIDHNTIVKLARGETTVEEVELKQTAAANTYTNVAFYRFRK